MRTSARRGAMTRAVHYSDLLECEDEGLRCAAHAIHEEYPTPTEGDNWSWIFVARFDDGTTLWQRENYGEIEYLKVDRRTETEGCFEAVHYEVASHLPKNIGG